MDAQKELETALLKINESKAILRKLKKDDFLNAKELFTSLRELHNAYYLSLIVKLGLQADVLDADGD